MRLSLVYIVFLFLYSCSTNTIQKNILKGEAFGTTYTVVIFNSEKNDIKSGIDSVINKVNKSVSTYLPSSDISKINKGDSTLVVDQIFKDNFLLSEDVYLKTRGYFDPTVGVLRNAYGFGDKKPLKKMDSTRLDSLLKYVGFHKVKLTKEGNIKKMYPEIYFDFNAVAKGYGIDRIGEYLTTLGLSNYLIELGGEILAKGVNIEKDKPWTVGIENVDSQLGNRQYSSVVKLNNEAMAASGNYRKFRVDSLTGKKYVHTLNPLTGSAEKSDVTSATVIAATCALADAYATSFMALGLEKSKLLLQELEGIEAYLTYNNPQNIEDVFVTNGFSKHLVD